MVLALVTLVGLAGVGVSQAANNERPTSCGVRTQADGTVLVTWFAGGDWVNIVRNGERLVTTSSRDDGSRYTDERPPGGATTYGVGVGDFGGLVGETLVCGTVQTETGIPLEAPPRCQVTIENDYDEGAIELEWDGVVRATEYVIWNNGRQIHTTAGSRYDVPGRYDGLEVQHFAVSAKDGDEIGPKTYCGKILPYDRCSATALADGTVEITFESSGQVEIRRNDNRWARPFADEVNGSIIDTNPVASAQYTMRELDEIGRLVGQTFDCGTVQANLDAPIQSVAECSVSLLNSNHIRVNWTPTPLVSQYIVWNNGRRIAQTAGLTTFDTNSPYTGDTTQHFAVSSMKGSVVTPKTYCGNIVPEDLGDPGVQPSCSVTRDGSTDAFDVRWTGTGSAEVVVRRTVDGSPWYWRGRTPDSQFVDTHRAGDVRYQIALRSSDGSTGAAIGCASS